MDIPANPTPEEVWRAFQRLGTIATGRALEAVSIGTSATEVRHYLGRVPEHWFELSPANGAAVVKEASTARDETYIYLIASSAVTASIWIW